MNLKLTSILVLFTVFGLMEAADDSQPQTLSINELYPLTIEPFLHKKYEIILPDQIGERQNLFIEAQAKFNDPYQMPYMKINSEDGLYTQQCFQEGNDYSDICEIPNGQLQPKRKFFIDVMCIVSCSLEIGAYFNTNIRIYFNKDYQINSLEELGVSQVVTLIVPDTEFDQIIILTYFTNFDEIDEGLEIYANYGSNPSLPTQQQHMLKAEPSYNHMLTLTMSKEEVGPGDAIEILVVMGKNMKIQMSAQMASGKQFNLALGQPFIGTSQFEEQKVFVLDLYDQSLSKSDTISISVIIYSGDPEIKVSFTPDFPLDQILDNYFIEKKMNFLITGAIREQLGYESKVYIKVQSYWSANFYIKAMINQKDFIDMNDGIVEMIELAPNQLENFIFEDRNIADPQNPDQEMNINYKITGTMMEGSAEIGIRICYSLQQQDTLDCLLTSIDDLADNSTKQSFSQIEISMKKQLNNYYIYFNYNVASCPSYYRKNGDKVYLCEYQIIFININSYVDMYAGVEIEKRTTTKYLLQGQIVKDSVSQQAYNYYAFDVLNTNEIEWVSVYVTDIQGDSSLLLSKTVRYPQIDDYLEGNANFSLYNAITLMNSQLKNGTYYIGILGYEMSDYTISLVFKRKSNETTNPDDQTDDHQSHQKTITKIQLNKGDTQSYNLDGFKNQQFIFTITSLKNQLNMVQVIPLKGVVNFTVKPKDSEQKLCDSLLFSNPNDICRFNSTQKTAYYVYVTASKNQSSLFTISYWTQEVCLLYPNQIPFYILVAGQQTTCLSFLRKIDQDIEISISMGAYDIIANKLRVTAIFPLKQVQLKAHEKIFDEEQLELLCDAPQQNNNEQCQFQLKFENFGNDTESMLAIMGAIQSVSQETILFQGISEKIVSKQISEESPKTFYYYIRTPSQDTQKIDNIMITLDSKTQAKFQMAATIVDLDQFVVDPTGQLYPKFDSKDQMTVVVNSSSHSPLSILTLDPNKLIQKFNWQRVYVMLVSVFPLRVQTQFEQIFIFEIQATQTQTMLPFGSSRIGYLEKQQFFTYVITPNPSIPSIISIRSLNQKPCVKSYETVYSRNEPIQFDQVLTFDKQTGKSQILIEGIGQKLCTYQIVFKALEKPITSVKTGIPYQVSLKEDNSIDYYVYQHKNSESFSILPVISNGDARVYATMLNRNTTLIELMDKNVQLYEYKTNTNNEVLQINNPSCNRCLFFIAVKGQPKAELDLFINLDSSPIPLKQSAYLKDSVKKSEKKNYQFYSITTFNITVRVLYGKIGVKVINPSGQQTMQIVSKDKTIVVPQPQSAKQQFIDYFNEDSRFQIVTHGIERSGYYISVHKIQAELKIIEGMPVILQVHKQIPKNITFDSIEDSSSLYVLVENMNYTRTSDAQLKFNVTAINSETTVTDMVKDFSKIEGSFNIQIKNFKGSYFMTISSDRDATIELIIAKKAFTHLMSGSSILMKNQGIFEIFSPGASIMIETFVCQGDISITASSNISELLDNDYNGNGVVHMEHANYGGHYVVLASNLEGEYFIKIDQQNDEDQLLYQASYYLFDPNSLQDMPYKTFTLLDLQIQHRYHKGYIEFLLSPVVHRDHKEIKENVEYLLYISDTIQSVKNITKCGLGTAETLIENSNDGSLKKEDDKISFQIENQKVRKLVEEGRSFYVGAEAKVYLDNPKYLHPDAAYFVYDVSQLLLNNSPEFHKDNKNLKFVVVWIIFPFLIGSILLYLAARFCIRSFSAYPSQLIEEDPEYGPSQQGINQQQGQ